MGGLDKRRILSRDGGPRSGGNHARRDRWPDDWRQWSAGPRLRRRSPLGRLGARCLGEAREEIDALNVFPVPDGDTGTNMYLTLESAVTAASAVPEDAPVARLADAFARGALLGARGNSGVIGAQLLRGWADTLGEYTQLSAASAVEGFRRADEQAWLAVNDPVEGTILSVSRAAARRRPKPNPRWRRVVAAAADAAQQALELTPTQLPALARAGVVDAGGRGLVVLIDSLAELVLGASRRRPARTNRHPALPAVDFSSCHDLSEAAGGPAYEVMFLLDTPDTVPDAGSSVIGPLRARLADLGDSLVVVGGAGLWQVHVHVHDPGAAIEAAVEFGRPHRIRIEALLRNTAGSAAALRVAMARSAGPRSSPARPGRDWPSCSWGSARWWSPGGLADVRPPRNCWTPSAAPGPAAWRCCRTTGTP